MPQSAGKFGFRSQGQHVWSARRRRRCAGAKRGEAMAGRTVDGSMAARHIAWPPCTRTLPPAAFCWTAKRPSGIDRPPLAPTARERYWTGSFTFCECGDLNCIPHAAKALLEGRSAAARLHAGTRKVKLQALPAACNRSPAVQPWNKVRAQLQAARRGCFFAPSAGWAGVQSGACAVLNSMRIGLARHRSRQQARAPLQRCEPRQSCRSAAPQAPVARLCVPGG